jgi:hypothetical protein
VYIIYRSDDYVGFGVVVGKQQVVIAFFDETVRQHNNNEKGKNKK